MSIRETVGGTGKALQPSIPPVLSERSTPQIDHLFSTLVEAAFDLIEEVADITLAVYLHVPHNDQPILFARYPRLEMMSPTDVFRLMHTTTMLSNGRKPVSAFRHGDLNGHYVRTSGAVSDGLLMFGPIQQPQTAKRMTAVSRAFARVLHQFHLDEVGGSFIAPLLRVDPVAEVGHAATVTVKTTGDDRQGTATAETPEAAVGQAVLAAIAPDYQFDEVRTIAVGTKSAVLVVTHDRQKVLRLGLAISDGDVLQTVAVATQRAVSEGQAGIVDLPAT